MEKPEFTLKELERLRFRLSEIDMELQGILKYIDRKYVEISIYEQEKTKKDNAR